MVKLDKIQNASEAEEEAIKELRKLILNKVERDDDKSFGECMFVGNYFNKSIDLVCSDEC